MPKRPECSKCGTQLRHKIRYQIIEVEGEGSGQTKRVINTLCKVCVPIIKTIGN